jgi:hypothetical protein
MTTLRLPSRADGCRVYVLSPTLFEDQRFYASHGGACMAWAAQYPTHGDGTTQHGPLMPITLDDLPDFCASVLEHLLAHPMGAVDDAAAIDPWALVAGQWPRHLGAPEDFAFLTGLRYDGIGPPMCSAPPDVPVGRPRRSMIAGGSSYRPMRMDRPPAGCRWCSPATRMPRP